MYLSMRKYVANVSASVAGVNNRKRKQHELRVGNAMKNNKKKLTNWKEKH